MPWDLGQPLLTFRMPLYLKRLVEYLLLQRWARSTAGRCGTFCLLSGLAIMQLGIHS